MCAMRICKREEFVLSGRRRRCVISPARYIPSVSQAGVTEERIWEGHIRTHLSEPVPFCGANARHILMPDVVVRLRFP